MVLLCQVYIYHASPARGDVHPLFVPLALHSLPVDPECKKDYDSCVRQITLFQIELDMDVQRANRVHNSSLSPHGR